MSTPQERLQETAEKFRGPVTITTRTGWPPIGLLEDDIWHWKERAEQAERELVEARAREQQLRETLEHVLPYVEHYRCECGFACVRAVDMWNHRCTFTDTDDQKRAAEALRPTGGEA